MKRYFLCVALLGLGLSACKKEQTEKLKEDAILIDGEEFERDFVYRNAARILNMPKDSIYYNPQTHTLNIDYINFSMDMEIFAIDLRNAKAKNL